MKKYTNGVLLLLLAVLTFAPLRAENKLKVALLGDSMTWIGGDSFEKPKGWTHYVDDLPIEMKTYARSGATWTNTKETKGDTNAYSEVLDPENVIYNQALRLTDDTGFKPDVVIIYAGTNDAWFSSKRPGLFGNTPPASETIEPGAKPADFTTLEGSIMLTNTLLRHRLPDVRIYLVTPANSGKISECAIQKVSEIIEKTGRKTGATVVRGDKLFGFHHKEEKTKPYRFTYDGVHTNEKGARKIADIIKSNILLPETVRLKDQNQ